MYPVQIIPCWTKDPDSWVIWGRAGHLCSFPPATPKAIFAGLVLASSWPGWSGHGHATQLCSAHGSRQESSRGAINAGGRLPSLANQVCKAVLVGELEQREVCAAGESFKFVAIC